MLTRMKTLCMSMPCVGRSAASWWLTWSKMRATSPKPFLQGKLLFRSHISDLLMHGLAARLQPTQNAAHLMFFWTKAGAMPLRMKRQ